MTTLRKSKRNNKSTVLLLIIILLCAGISLGYFFFFEGEVPHLELSGIDTHVGTDATIYFTAQDSKSGLRKVSLTMSQGDTRKELYSGNFPRQGYTGMIGQSKESQSISFSPKKMGFSDGPATISLSASDFSAKNFFSGNKSEISKQVLIDTAPPKVHIIHSERYINPGGAGIVIYRLDDLETTSGVYINSNFHPGFPVADGRDDIYISYFALPFNAESITNSYVSAQDKAGNLTKVPFNTVYKKKLFKQDKITVGNGFLEKKIPEFQQFYPEMQGNLVERYLYTNNDVREANNSQISLLCKSPHPTRLWSERFQRMPGSTRAGYADHRTYYHDSKPIDKQVHLGIDIASTKHADVKAAETGIVVHADYLGIYGNMVLLDHGQGVFSLYSHLSQINVAVGDMIDKGVVLGLTGTSGMAGGDHLHFSMLINGIFVTPTEWWDQHWINVTIEDPLTESRF